MYYRCCFWIILLLAANACFADTVIGYRFYNQSIAHNDDSIFNVSTSDSGVAHEQVNQFYVRYQDKGFNLSGNYNLTFDKNHDTKNDPVLNELYYDFSLKDFDLTIGKKVMSWGVGYAYRPLDLIQQEDRRVLITQNLEGVPLGSVSYYTGDTALSLFVLNRELKSGYHSRKQDYEAALRAYTLLDNWDLYGIVHYADSFGMSAGFGFATVFGESLEIHASTTYRTRYHKNINALTESTATLAQADPFYEKDYNNCINSLAGFTWTFENRISILGEAWHDCTGYTNSEWSALRDLTKQQQALLNTVPLPAPQAAIEGQIQGNQRYFNQANILQNNLFLRVSYEGEKTDPALDLLFTPGDGGVVLSSSIEHELKQNILLFGSARYFGGKSDSAFRQLPDRAMLFLGFRAEMVL